MAHPAKVRAVVKAARRRELAAALLDHVGRGLWVGAGVSLIAMIAAKALNQPFHWVWLVAGPLVLGGVLGALRAVSRMQHPLGTAIRLDGTLGLRDRLSTALELEALPAGHAPQDAAFVTLAGNLTTLNQLQASDIRARVELTSVQPGSYDLPVRVEPPPNTRVVSVQPETASVTIPPPQATVFPTSTPTRTPGP